MLVPAVMFLEMALEQMKRNKLTQTQAELKELKMLGEDRIAQARAALPAGSTDLEVGYELCLTTVRVLLAMKSGIELARQIAAIDIGPMSSGQWLNRVSFLITTSYAELI